MQSSGPDADGGEGLSYGIRNTGKNLCDNKSSRMRR